ncbi:Uncharacterized protein BM_BM9483 [Brugia malayi]|uniref:Bm9483 n=1 Tax=Brugia malayi TaxID=6279 RepID=A0A4E9EP14_BRUMA|nr:Uncharacterized protein BM_BM9483 [Brugia malayi]VIO85983.1 Uncharacterized protein BM_BM9483 [Brugia malayi]
MERQCMEFIDVDEMELFMSRYLVTVYDDRLYIRRDHMQTLSAINKLSNVSFDSILPDDFISIVFEYMKRQDKKSCLNVMHCLLSLAVSLHDPWSTTRLLNKVCPKVLPALRRSAQASMGYLDIMSVLISYVMTAPVEGDCNVDVELHANFPVLKKLVDTVITMNETLQSGTQSNQAVKSALQIAAEFMVIIPNYTNPSVINKMIIYLNKNIEQISANFAAISSTIWNNEYQTKTPNQTDAYVIAVSLCDRLTCLNVAEDIGVVSPLFKTPNNKAVSNPLTPLNQKVVAEETTPDMQERRIANFINIDTPISRSLDKVEMFNNPTASLKENILAIPKNSERKNFPKALISISKKKELPCGKLNPFTDVKYRKCKKKDVKGQTKITNFFKKYS